MTRIKNYVLLGLMFVLVAFQGVAQAQTKLKFGHINSDELLQMMPGLDSVKTTLQKYQQDIQTELQNMQMEYETKVNDYLSKQEGMTELIKQNKAQEIQELEGRIQAFTQQANQDIAKKQEELLSPIIDKAKKAIEEVAKENGYTYILDSVAAGVVLYATPSEDIMPLVKKKLGLI